MENENKDVTEETKKENKEEISKNALEGQKHNHLIFNTFTLRLIFSIFINK